MMHEFPKRETLLLKGWLRSYRNDLPAMLAREAGEQWIRSDPHAHAKLQAKESPKLKKRLARAADQIIEALRLHKFYETADHVQTARGLEKKARIFNEFLDTQEREFGKAEDRPTPILCTPENLTALFFEGNE